MHEAGLMKGLMRQIESLADAEGSARVVVVSVWLGALSHFSPEHFEAHFRQASQGTCAEGARIAATTSDDITHPRAMDVAIESVEVEV